VRLVDLEALRASWPGSELLTMPQAHFGYGMIPEAVEWLGARHLLAPRRSQPEPRGTVTVAELRRRRPSSARAGKRKALR
jgi:hypothetical protein